MKEARMKIVVDRIPQSPEECFFAHYLISERPTCWCVTGDCDGTQELCRLGIGQKCPYCIGFDELMKGEHNENPHL